MIIITSTSTTHMLDKHTEDVSLHAHIHTISGGKSSLSGG